MYTSDHARITSIVDHVLFGQYAGVAGAQTIFGRLGRDLGLCDGVSGAQVEDPMLLHAFDVLAQQRTYGSGRSHHGVLSIHGLLAVLIVADVTITWRR